MEELKEVKDKSECYHINAYTFHENAPMRCPDCGWYISFEEYQIGVLKFNESKINK